MIGTHSLNNMNVKQLHAALSSFLASNPKLADTPVLVSPTFGTNLYRPYELMDIQFETTGPIGTHISLRVKHDVPLYPNATTEHQH